MKISIFGLGYVGAVSAACLAQEGHEVIGVDPVRRKVDLINSGCTPIIEEEVGDIIKRQVRNGRLSATTDPGAAVAGTELVFVCVGTPSRANGDIDLTQVARVCEEIGQGLRDHHGAPTIVIRSTMLPGTMRSLVIPTLEAHSGRVAGVDFGVCINPEFLREGTAVQDFYHPPKTVIGELNPASGELLHTIYGRLPAPMVRTEIETAELVKYVDNVWHALKVGFANEIGNLCKGLAVDSHQVMNIFCRDTKLNLSPYYLKPGFAFGGSCLPKDLKALLYKAKTIDVSLPILTSILPSNRQQIDLALRAITDLGERKVGVLGLSFKPGTDDLRDSPMVELTERLIGKGHELKIYDANVALASIHGANRDYILNRIPHISRLMAGSIDEVLDHGKAIVIGNAAPEFKDVPRRANGTHTIVDLVRVTDSRTVAGVYEGLCW